jgi:N-acetylmuramoyl-L-alanine amidase
MKAALLTGVLLSFAALGASGLRAVEPGEFAVAIDIGHTPAAPGAKSARGQYEYYFNKRLSEQLLQALTAAGYKKSFLINPGGGEITLPARAQAANERRANLFLAIHHDAVQDSYLQSWVHEGEKQRYCDQFSGYSVFCSARNPRPKESLRWAGLLGREMLAAGIKPTWHHAEKIPGESKELLDRERGVYEYTNLIVLKGAAMPAALLECGVIVNRAEEAQLLEPGRQRQTIAAIVRAVSAYAKSQPAEAVPIASAPTTDRLPAVQAAPVLEAVPELPRSVVPRTTIPLPPAASRESKY